MKCDTDFLTSVLPRLGPMSLSLTLVGLLLPQLAQGAVPKDLRKMWSEGQYQVVLPRLIAYRDEPYGKDPEVDYMIATSACRVAGMEEEGRKFFKWILSYYQLDLASRRTVADEMQLCAQRPEPPQVVFKARTALGGGGASGKMFFFADQDAPIRSYPAKTKRDIPLETITQRLAELSRPTEGIKIVQELVGSKFRVVATEHFILASSSDHSQKELMAIGSGLETVQQFYMKNFGMARPPYFVTVYLVPNTSALRALADQLHGLDMAPASIGYSYREDLSMVGVIPRMLYGTLLHELFHVMVRSNFGDVPPWLDEGTAALYEVAEVDGARVIGVDNWRGEVLRMAWDLHPPVDRLVQMNWQIFENEQLDEIKQAVNYATARYFVLYLQELGKLSEVHRVFRNRDVRTSSDDPAGDSVKLLSSVLGRPLAAVEADFDQWFKTLPKGQRESRGNQRTLIEKR